MVHDWKDSSAGVIKGGVGSLDVGVESNTGIGSDAGVGSNIGMG